MEALQLYPVKLSPTGCGHPIAEATDRRQRKVREFVCETCRQQAIVDRHYAEVHEGANPDRDGALPGDGFGAWVVPLDTPDDEEG